MQHKYIASYPAQFGGHKGSLMIVHLQPVFIHPKRYQRWSDHEKIASRPILIWGTVHFQSVGRGGGGGEKKLFWVFKKAGPPQIPPAPFPPPPPPHKKWTVSEWSKSRVNGAGMYGKIPWKHKNVCQTTKVLGRLQLFYLFYPLLSPAPCPMLNKT